jgi:hypothetical protein
MTKLVKGKFDGLSTGEIGILLNKIGFRKVTIVTSDLRVVDYSWSNYKKKHLIECLSQLSKCKKEADGKYEARKFVKWLSNKDYENDLIIDYDFSYYLKSFLQKNKPVGITFNWNVFFRYPKINSNGVHDPYNGDASDHIVVAYGYDKKGVYICDSHHELYKYKRKKYRNGFYKISWLNLMTVVGQGDIVFPEDYHSPEGNVQND